MLDYQQRVVDELDSLATKADALEVFIDSETYAGLNHPEQMALLSQCFVMAQYKQVLDYRISLFVIEAEEKENEK